MPFFCVHDHFFKCLKTSFVLSPAVLQYTHWKTESGTDGCTVCTSMCTSHIQCLFTEAERQGPVFTKGLRLSQVFGLNPVLKLRLLSQLSFVLKPYSQRVT